MRPFLIVAGDFVSTGGMDMANLALARHLAKRGYPLHLVAHRVDAELAAAPNVRFHRVPKPGGSYFAGEPLLDRAGRRQASLVAAEGGCVIVNGGNCRWPGAVKWVHYVHDGHEPSAAGWRRWLRLGIHLAYTRQERAALRGARLVIANSDRTRRDVERTGVAGQRVRRVYYGSDGLRFRPTSAVERDTARRELGWPRARAIAVFVGALGDRHKGFDTLFAAWHGIDADLVVVGDGAERREWEERSRAERRPIRFLGRRDDVPRILAACDALVSPARYEAYGLGVHEAICAGLPAIAPRDSGVAERYPDGLRDLLLSDPEDAAELTAKLALWHANRETFAARARPFAGQMLARGWDDMGREIVELVEAAHGES